MVQIASIDGSAGHVVDVAEQGDGSEGHEGDPKREEESFGLEEDRVGEEGQQYEQGRADKQYQHLHLRIVRLILQ